MVDRLHNIVRGCQDGNRGAQRDLYDMFKSKMFGVCLRYAGNYHDAEDIMQEGFVKVFEKIGQFSYKGSFEGWIRKVMVNTALEKYRMHFQTVTLYDNLPETDHEAVKEISGNIEVNELMNIIQELTPKYRIVFNLFALEGYSHKEIGAMLNISEGTSKSNLSRARVILQEKVNKYYSKSIQTS